MIVDGKLSDLKRQLTPFFTAQRHVGIEPRWAVSFNDGDYRSYTKHANHGVDVQVYFWVSWKELSRRIGGTIYTVETLEGVWTLPFTWLASLIEGRLVVSHDYLNRVEDTQGNEKTSYYFDLRWMNCLGRFDQGEGL